MIKVANVKELPLEQWLEMRRAGIGGSDAAAVCGFNPWKSPIQVYMDKMGLSEEQEGSERLRIGQDLEDYVAKRFEEETKKKVRRNNFLLAHDEHDFMLANLDRVIVGENAFLECKTTGSYSKGDWEGDKIPLQYQFQLNHYMAVGGYDKAYIAVLIGNERFAWKEVVRDEAVIVSLMAIEKDFWENHVLQELPPPADGSRLYDEYLKERFKEAKEDLFTVNLDAYEAQMNRIDELKTLIANMETEQKTLEQELKEKMGENNTAFCKERKITWKTQERTTLDSARLKKDHPDLAKEYSKTSSTRVFRIY